MPKLHYEWDRFWCPREATFSLGDAGYLVDPTTEWGRRYYPHVVPFAELGATPCLVLLGAPGIGKSSAVSREYGRVRQLAHSAGSPLPLLIDLRAYGSEDRLFRRLTEAPEIRAWADGDAVLDLFLDSLDECLLRVDTLAAMLPEALEHLPTDRLRLRVVCRTGDWPQTLETGLIRRWGQERVGVYELAPLRRVDVAAAAVANRLDADEFLAEVAECEAEALANRPITLDFLLRKKLEGGRLPARRVDLYLSGCGFLAAENNEARLEAGYRGPVDVGERLRLAARIAAATVFGNRYAVWVGPEAGPVPQEDLTFRELKAGWPDSPGPSDSALKEVLGTGLFSSRGPNRMGWAHQTYAEFLAAHWAIESELDLDQVLGLLTSSHDPERRLVPQLHETAAWVASMRPDAFRVITELDPDALLRGDVATADPEQRHALAQALLDAYDSERIVDTDWGLRPLYRKLTHPGLHGQLLPYIADQGREFVARRAAINIAEACKVTDLQEELIRVALDSAEPIGLRDKAAHAAARVADPQHRPRLRPLLDLDRKEDPDDQIRGHALEALWPEHLSAEALFQSLTPLRRPNLYGQYKHFIRTYLPPTLRDDDLPAALEWVKERAPRHLHWHRDVLEELADEVVLRVWQSKPQGTMLGLFADVVLLRFEHHAPIVGRERERELSGLVWEDEEQRRALVLALLERITSEKQVWSVLHPGRPLVASGDVSWLLDWLVRGPESEGAKRFGAELLQRLFNRDDPDQVSEVIEATLRSEWLRSVLAPLVEPVELDSSRAAELKSTHAKYKALEEGQKERELRRPPLLDPPPAQRVQSALERCEAGDPDGFWKLTMELSLSPSSQRYEEEFDPDLTSLPGWQEAEPRTRERIVEAAKRYLRERDPEPARWLGIEWWYPPAFAGYKALRLVLATDPDFVTGLSPEDWARWSPVIVVYPFINSDPHYTIHKEIICAVYRAAPERVLEALGREIDRDNRSHGNVFGLEHFEDCWDDRLSRALLDKAAEPGMKAATFEGLLGAALSHGLAEAPRYARSLVQLPLSVDADDYARAVTAAALLLQHAPNEGWDEVWAALKADEDFGRKVVSAVAGSRQRQRLHEVLSEHHLAALYVWTSRRYPYTDDPDDDAEGVRVGPGDQMRWFREGLLNALRDRGTFEAVRALQWCIDELRHLDWLKYTLHDARARARSRTWLPPSPTEVLRLGETRNGRLVRSGSELLDAVAASLRRLEVKLQGDTPAAIDLWNGPDAQGRYQPKDENALSNYVRRHLQDDLGRRGVVVNREVEIRRGEGDATGENTDIHVNAFVHDPRGGALDVLTVIIEAKGCWHRELSSAMETQLAGRYLKDNPCRHGLYLVGWYNCPQWDSGDYRRRQAPRKSLEEARQQFEAQAEQLSSGDLEVRAFVLNAAFRH